MAKNRDSWDKLNRQKKSWEERGPGNGPAPINTTVRRLLKAKARRDNLEFQKRKDLADAFRASPRFHVSRVFQNWLKENQVDVATLINAVRSSLCDPQTPETSMPKIFWKLNQTFEEAREIADFTVTPSSQLATWLLKFKL